MPPRLQSPPGYRLEREIGRGGFGVVYRGEELETGEGVAIKVLSPGRDWTREQRARFLREAHLMLSFDHPNLVGARQIVDVGEHPFVVMDLVEGRSLGERVRGEGALTEAGAERLFRDLLEGLRYAHGRGLLHGDITPGNVLIEEATGRAILADFAAVPEQDGHILGTPEYMSPERVMGRSVDARSDLYSFGGTMYFALMGFPPFRGSSATETLAHQVATPAPPMPPRTRLGQLLSDMTSWCLLKSPSERPKSAAVLIKEFDDRMRAVTPPQGAMYAFSKPGVNRSSIRDRWERRRGKRR